MKSRLGNINKRKGKQEKTVLSKSSKLNRIIIANEARRKSLLALLFKAPNVITLSNAVSGMFSMFYSIRGELKTAVLLLILCAILDFFDGKVARFLRKDGEFGKQLDSLADIVSFGIAPTIFAYSVSDGKLALLSYVFFLSCGILRLAKFNVQRDQKIFYGMPTTMNAFIVMILYLAKVSAAYYPIVYFVAGALMVSPIRISKVGA